MEYQSEQSKNVFDNLENIVSFVGEEGNLARFIGVYKIIDRDILKVNNHFNYKMEELSGFDDLKERVIIEWKNPISWHQLIKNEMQVVQIQPGLHFKQFTDYSNLILEFLQLKEIVINEYPEWKKMLSSVKSVYLINDSKTGKLYVGSAYGERGIWGRWKDYIATGGHGGNKLLKDLIYNDSQYNNNFRFSILTIVPKTVTSDEAIRIEKLFKTKLGTNSFGLNSN